MLKYYLNKRLLFPLLFSFSVTVTLQAWADKPSMSAETLIQHLNLEMHREGGYFRRTFQADHRPKLQTQYGPRFTLTSIYYLLTKQRAIGHFHLNKSDIIHFFHQGDAIEYFLISPEGKLHRFTLGQDLQAGQVFQYTVPGGWWKASRLTQGEAGYGLISEAVAPGFEYADMTLGKQSELLKQFPKHRALIRQLTYRNE